MKNWSELTGGPTARDVQAGAGWLPRPSGYVLLAACQSHERAYETDFGVEGRHGALTYWLLDSWKRIDDRTTYRQLFNRVVAKVHALGMALHYWTIDDPAEASRLLALGADGIMTDDPARINPLPCA